MRKNLFFTIKEAVHNILKHAQATEASVTIDWQKNILRIVIADNGVGLTQERQFGNGLKNMRRRMEDIGGSIAFEVENGTQVRLEVML